MASINQTDLLTIRETMLEFVQNPHKETPQKFHVLEKAKSAKTVREAGDARAALWDLRQ